MSKKSKENINLESGEITPSEKFNEVIVKTTIRPNGTLRIQQDFSNCPSLAEQHTAHLTDINYLIERYKPDELAAYIAVRNQYRAEIIGHNFSNEPSLQDAKNVVYQSRQCFDSLSDELKGQFKNHVEFLKFLDNPNNANKLIKFGVITRDELNRLQIPDQAPSPIPLTPTPPLSIPTPTPTPTPKT